MIGRYSRQPMRDIWSEQRKLEIWLQIELLASEALCEDGVVPEQDWAQIKAKAAFDLDRCKELERTLNHDVIAFTTNVAEHIGPPASRWLHFGLTSSDILDTAFAVQLAAAADLLIQDLKELRQAVAAKAKKYQFTPMIGRSHGVHAEPITLGFKLAVMFDEFGRALRRMETARAMIAVGKLSGAVGTNAHLTPQIEAAVCRKLGLQPAPIATQIVQRDLHAEYATTLALVAASIERWATEFRHLQRTEVLETEEFFARGQKGSSAMPHKRNPITFERLTGLARVIRGHAVAALEDVALWHERDISHSSVERIIFPDACTLLDYMLVTLTSSVETLLVYPRNMTRNLELSLGLWNSQTVLLALIRKGLTREKAYELVQSNAMLTWKAKNNGDTQADFKNQLLKDPEVTALLSQKELDRLCTLDFHFKKIPARFKKLGLV